MTASPPPDSRIRLGVAGWSYPDWEGIVYPKPVPRSFDRLAFLAARVDAIEINSTFYHPGSAQNAESWARRVEPYPDFRFTVKLHQRLTHHRDPPSPSEIAEARVVPEILAEHGRLGLVLLQFPWSFRNEEASRARLFKLLDALAGLPVAVEVRRGNWNREEFFKSLAERGAAFVNLDQPLIGESLPPTGRVTAGRAYARFHGRNRADWFKKDAGRDQRYNYLYSREELSPWAGRLKKMADQGAEIYVIFNNHFKGKALANAAQMAKLLGRELQVPSALARRYDPGPAGKAEK